MDEASCGEVLTRLKAAGVLPEDIETSEALLTDYNQRMTLFEESDLEQMKSENLFRYQEGFVDTTQPCIAYGDADKYMERWRRSGGGEDIYCRIFAFLMLHNKLDISHYVGEDHWDEKAEFLYYDKQAMDHNGILTFSPQQQTMFLTLFEIAEIEEIVEAAEISDAASPEAICTTLQAKWKEYGVSFQESQISMISIWREGYGLAYNVHAAILLEDHEGLLLVEKTNPYFPYQATKFSSKSQVKDYMLDTMTFHYEKLEYPVPVMAVMENDCPM